MIMIPCKPKRRVYTLSEVELIQEFIAPLLLGAERGIKQARLAIKIADCQMHRGQLEYWKDAKKVFKWQLSILASKLEKLSENG